MCRVKQSWEFSKLIEGDPSVENHALTQYFLKSYNSLHSFKPQYISAAVLNSLYVNILG